MAEITFGEWLKRRRGAVGFTQKQLALQLNCSLSAVRKIEAEERRPSAEIVDQLMQIFEIPPEESKAFLRFSRGDWQAFLGEENEDAPWRVSRSTKISNLPAQLTTFIGREKDQDKVIDLISKNRLVTLAGVGGIGKTRLALQVGEKLLKSYTHGVWFVTLDTISNPSLIPQKILSIFNIREVAGYLIVETLINFLRKKKTLLILDNCEHLLEACAELAINLLQNCPNLRIIVTSREVLNLTGEAIINILPLSLPKQDKTFIDQLEKYEAIRLFTERARLVVSSFTLTDENFQPITNICRKVDGIPLALELAAARVNILQVEEILNQLNDSFVLLASDNQTSSLRHQTLQASMNWSWGLLNKPEQIFFRQLSVFSGGWTLASADEICDGDVLNMTNSLVKKSLVLVRQAAGRETRYQFHEIVRQYAHEKLIESGDEENIYSRHLKYFVQFTKEAEPALQGSAQWEWYTRLLDERDNIRKAVEWADKTDIEAGMLLLGIKMDFSVIFITFQELRYWLIKFLKRKESKAYPLARAKALLHYGWYQYGSGHLEDALRVAKECRRIFRAERNQDGEVDSLLLSGAAGRRLSDLQQALEISKSINDISRIAATYYRLGWATDMIQGIKYFDKAATYFHKSGDSLALELTFGTLALCRASSGDFALAQKNINEANMLWQSNPMIDIRINAKTAQSIIARERGDYVQARNILEEIITSVEELGINNSRVWHQTRLGFVAMKEGNTFEAKKIFIKTLNEFQRDNNVLGVVFTIECMAGIFRIMNRQDKALMLIGWADGMRNKLNNQRPPIEQQYVEDIINDCLKEMGEESFSDKYEAGENLSMDDIVAFALNSS